MLEDNPTPPHLMAEMPSARKNLKAKPATLADVGRAVGVSAMSASAVLNGSRTSTRISPETRNRILEEAARLRYRPNAAARALNRRQMSTLGLAAVVDSGELNAYFLEILNGVLEAAGRFNQNITVFTLHDWNLDAGRLADFCDGRIDGLILVAPVISESKSDIVPAHTPFVSLHSNNPIPGVIDIESDEEGGAFDIVSHLISQGHRDILHLAGPGGMEGSKRRLAGYQRALAAAKLGKNAKVIESGFSTENGRSAIRAWMSKNAGGVMPTALFCANDAVALGCMEVLAQAGLRVPEDVSIVGFDDTLAARTSTPQLTTLRQPLRQMGARAVELLIKPETAPQTKGELIIFPTQAVIRASVARPTVKPVIVPRL